jgi:hypothetical protein
MSKTFSVGVLLGCLVLGAIVTGGVSSQQMVGVSATYELFPLNTLGSSASFPLILREGKTILVNTVEYQYTVYDFDDWGFVQGTAGDTAQFHMVGYFLLLIQQLRGKWTLVANCRPRLASDFEGDISMDDFAVKGMLIFLYTLNDTLSFGPGVTYSLRDAPVFPVPFLRFEWKPNPLIVIEGVIPDNVTVMYRPHPAAEVGVFARTMSVNHHGDSARYAADNAWLAYSDLSVGPIARFHYKKWVHVTAEGGYSFLRKFTFYDDGSKEESIDLDAAAYLKVGLQIGM